MSEIATERQATKIERLPVGALLPYARNSREHSADQVREIAASIREFGFTNPVLIDEHNGIIAGHGRVMAAQELSMPEVPCIRLSYLTEVQKRAYVIADNKIALNSKWNTEVLAGELGALQEWGFDTELTGFDAQELQVLLAPKPLEGLTDEDDVPEEPAEPISVAGDVWICGQHRVMCGDSTDAEQIAQLMNLNRVDLVFTDPPYGIDYQDVKKNHDKIANDGTLTGIKKLIANALANDCPMFVCCNWKSYATFEALMIAARRDPKACIVWNKKKRVQNLDRFAKVHEFVLYHGPFGGEKTVDIDVWDIERESRDDHPTPKPVELITRAIEHTTTAGANVQDLFGGSGSTLIACEKTGRKCFTMELEPKFADVIVRRWEAYTGKKAVNERTGETFDGYEDRGTDT